MNEQNGNGLPLQGLKVVEMGQLIAGPFASKMLGEFDLLRKIAID